MDLIRYFGLIFSTILLLCLSLEVQTVGGNSSYWDSTHAQPYFENSTRRVVTAVLGQAAYLHCRVRNLGDLAVSWIRKRDLHILTVGILTYTNDQRFQSIHTEGSDEWTLRITSAQRRDSGTYECQVSTEPKISQGFRMNVVVARAKILGNSELFIKSGSNINLTCRTMQTAVPPSYIYWYKGNDLVNYSQVNGISVITEAKTRTSRLIIAAAKSTDSGNYTCAPSNSESASVMIHVISGEQPAAMQHGNSSSSANSIHRLPSILKHFQRMSIYLQAKPLFQGMKNLISKNLYSKASWFAAGLLKFPDDFYLKTIAVNLVLIEFFFVAISLGLITILLQKPFGNVLGYDLR